MKFGNWVDCWPQESRLNCGSVPEHVGVRVRAYLWPGGVMVRTLDSRGSTPGRSVSR